VADAVGAGIWRIEALDHLLGQADLLEDLDG
jgi:hypothetical protein